MEFVVLLPFLLFFLLVGFDFMRWIATAFSIQHVAELTLNEIREKGMNERISSQVTEWLKTNRLDPEQWTITVIPADEGQGIVAFRSRVPFRAFSLLGLNVSVPVEAKQAFRLREKRDSFEEDHSDGSSRISGDVMTKFGP